jgi:hypothetical protein
MIEMLRVILHEAMVRLEQHATLWLPSLLAASILLVGALAAATFVRWLIYRIFKGLAIDRFLRQTGVAFIVDRSGRLRATRLVAEAAYWSLLLTGILVGLSVFNTDLTTQIVQGFVFLLPKLVVAGLILIAGAWLSQYLGRSVLVWAVDENLPSPRKLAAATRVVLMFVAVVVAADQLNFARTVFLAAFMILVGGAVLAASLALGLGAGARVRTYLEERKPEEERSLWSHL